MRRAIFASVILLSVALVGQASAIAATAGAPHHTASRQTVKGAGHAKSARTTPSSSNVVTYDRDSKDPNIGWHNDGGMRVCHQDCDNPEIPGSGYTCRDVQVLGMAMRECDSSN
jgi:hypothetical protein